MTTGAISAMLGARRMADQTADQKEQETAPKLSAPVGSAGDQAITVLFGGPSAEHDVSIVSGTAIAEALRVVGRSVEQILIDLEGGWWQLPDGHARGNTSAAAYDDPREIGARGPFTAATAIDRLAVASPRPTVFIALHGPFGEDGTVQALLESAGLCYTGAGVAASAIGMDKLLFKRLARGAGLPVVDWTEVSGLRWAAARPAVLADLMAFGDRQGDPRLMVKPARLGSSVGMTIVHDSRELAPAIELALGFDTDVLVEHYLPRPRELEVSVLGNDPQALRVFGPGEVFPGREFYDYQAKYLPGVSQTVTQAVLPPERIDDIRRLAADAYRLIGVEGFARIDFLLSSDRLFLSEINTIPGFTPISLFPMLPMASGLAFADICTEIVRLARLRHARRVTRRLSPADLPR